MAHPTYDKEYDKNRNPICVEGKSPIKHDKAWRKAMEKEFSEKYGAWWVFAGMTIHSNQYQKTKKPHWIMQFRKKEDR